MVSERTAAGLRLFTLGFLTLFVELLLIRYLAGTVWNLGYFPNLVLIAVFVGMGAGFLLHVRVAEAASRRLFEASGIVFLLLVALVFVARPAVPGFSATAGTLGGELFFTSFDDGRGRDSLLLLLALFAVVALLAALISQRTAKFFRRFPPLVAYTLDIGGSCLGILAFVGVSFLEIPAWVWIAFLAVPYLVVLESRTPRVALVVGCVALSAALAYQQDTRLFANPDYDGPLLARWSPYQKVEVSSVPPPEIIYVNGIAHQSMQPGELLRRSFYGVPYRARARRPDLPPYRTVLVIGAGAGNDVSVALLEGATHVDAVEIDPVIAQLGVERHPSKPYADPRVSLVVDDGRAFMVRATRKYDLVVFALTDSLVKVSSLAQLRLENYIFTKESIARAYDLLSDSGALVFYNYYRFPWLVDRFSQLIHAATGKYPRVRRIHGDFHLLTVSRLDPGAPPSAETASLPIPVDDWPFLYLRERSIPRAYLYGMLVLGACIAALLAAVRKSGEASPEALPVRLAFLLMGTAFLLLETKSVIQFSLLFGTTWLNNSLVFLAILVLVLLANWTAAALRGDWVLWPAYALVVGFAMASVFYPLGSLLSWENELLRFVVASLFTFAPIFFGNLIFSISFRHRKMAENLFGWNLLGATIGGMLEYTSMIFGYRSLAVIVAICYTLVLVALRLAPKPAAVPAAR